MKRVYLRQQLGGRGQFARWVGHIRSTFFTRSQLTIVAVPERYIHWMVGNFLHVGIWAATLHAKRVKFGEFNREVVDCSRNIAINVWIIRIH